ncbi:MAG: hypothetical protein ACRES5_21160 [Pseudomonas sp.]|uniref:hypothetical protein n=1 Tax=Stenotrophomonas sp. TaxID=69392 RepID=UPI003D6CD6BF
MLESIRKRWHHRQLAKCVAITAALMVSGACQTASAADASRLLANAEVVARSPLPPYTGLVETWVVLTVKVQGTAQDVLLPYFSEEQLVPEVGRICDFSVHSNAVNGIAGNQVVNGTFTVVDHTQCHEPHA